MSAAFNTSICAANIATLRAALNEGRLSVTALVYRYLQRIAYYDRHGIRLNAVPVLNPLMFEEAAAADERRRSAQCRGPLDGIPYLAKASYSVQGLPLTSGSPAFEHLIAREDAFVIAQLRAAGAILIGLSNMPPMAAGGMQRGLFGRAESPYNPAFLTAAFASGSSNGSGSGLAAGFAAFALAEETWSSGRAPASNNGLVAYTPSRGLISMRGNWPLIPTMDVVVPYGRSVADVLEVLNLLVVDDHEHRGDFWRTQTAVPLAPASSLRPKDYTTLADPSAWEVGAYCYIYRADYGSPEVDRVIPRITGIDAAPDGLSVRVHLDTLTKGHIHEFHLPGVRDIQGDPLLHTAAYYTLNEIPQKGSG